ncbi:hypothetical protein [Sphingopyxis fribergensis]|jgi:uncharacterized membrane protein YhaH (DUF805 family)
MGARLEQTFAWHGLTNRDEYRRWLPLIVAVDVALLWALYEFGGRGTINLSDFGLTGTALFVASLPYFIGWLFLTARRFRSADISRGWLILAVLTINIPVGDFHVNISMIAAILLTAVAALAPDRDPAPAV